MSLDDLFGHIAVPAKAEVPENVLCALEPFFKGPCLGGRRRGKVRILGR